MTVNKTQGVKGEPALTLADLQPNAELEAEYLEAYNSDKCKALVIDLSGKGKHFEMSCKDYAKYFGCVIKLKGSGLSDKSADAVCSEIYPKVEVEVEEMPGKGLTYGLITTIQAVVKVLGLGDNVADQILKGLEIVNAWITPEPKDDVLYM